MEYISRGISQYVMRGSEYKILKTTQSLLFFPFFINKEKRRRRREALTVCIDYSWKARTDVYTSEPSGCFFFVIQLMASRLRDELSFSKLYT